MRIIASTSVDLQEAVKAGTFRSDLLMSLDVVEIAVPALRNRPEDIPLLAERYLALFKAQNHAHAIGITSDALFAMNKYSWPGNIRELRNVIERAVLLCRSENDRESNTFRLICLIPIPLRRRRPRAAGNHREEPRASGGGFHPVPPQGGVDSRRRFQYPVPLDEAIRRPR